MTKVGLRNKLMCHKKGPSYTLYLNHPFSVRKVQINQPSLPDICVRLYTGEFYSYPMDSQVGLEAVSVVQEIFMKIKDVNVSYKCKSSS